MYLDNKNIFETFQQNQNFICFIYIYIYFSRYGNEVGEVVGNAVFSIGNLALTTHNVQSLGVKAIAKKTAKDTGKAVLKDYVEKEKKTEEETRSEKWSCKGI